MSSEISKIYPGCRLRGFVGWNESRPDPSCIDEIDDLTGLIKKVHAEKLKRCWPDIDAPPNKYYGWVRECGRENCVHCFEFKTDANPKDIPLHLKRVIEAAAKKGEEITSARYCSCSDVVGDNWASANHGYGFDLRGEITTRIGSKVIIVNLPKK